MKNILLKILSVTLAATLVLVSGFVEKDVVKASTPIYGILLEDGTFNKADSNGNKIGTEKISEFAVTHLFIDSNVTSIEENLFNSYTNFISIDFKNATSLTTIGKNAFNNCYNLTTVDFNGATALTTINEQAFSQCTNLSNINFNGTTSLTTICQYAFSDSDNLTTINFSDSVNLNSIDPFTFSECKNLTSINISSANSNFTSEDGVLFSKDKKILYLYPIGKEDINYTIPNTVEKINEYAFNRCTILESIDFTNATSLKTIEINAFSRCNNLTNINLNNSTTLENINENAFGECANLITVNLNNTTALKNIGSGAFAACPKLTTVNLNNATALECIGMGTFAECDNLTTVDLTNVTSLKTIMSGGFAGCPKLTTVDLSYATNLENVEEDAFTYCPDLKTIYVSDADKITLFDDNNITDGCEVLVKTNPVTPPEDPGDEPGEDPGTEPEEDPGDEPGEDPGTEPEEDPGTKPEDEPAITKPEVKSNGNAANTIKPVIKENSFKVIFTDKELAGTDKLEINLKVDEIKKDNINKSEKEIISNYIKDLKGKIKIDTVLDIYLEKIVGTTTTKLTNLPSDIEITINIPDSLKGKNKEFSIIKIHNNKIDLLKDLDTNPNTITFKTDEFSTYMIAETIPATTVDNSNETNKDTTKNTANTTDNPKTGSNSNIYLLVFLQLAFLGLIKIAYDNKKSKN